MVRVIASLMIWVAAAAYGQPAPAPQFEVASVRPSGADATNGSSSINTRTGRLTMTNATLRQCIVAAYRVKDYQLSGGPGWLNSDRYDIVAKADEGVKDDVLMPMLQTLLAERFQLAIHRETKMFQAYVLEVARNGPKLEKAEPEGGSNTNSSRNGTGQRTITAQTTMSRFAETLSRTLERPVVDRTGLDGRFNLKLEWTDSARPSGDGATPESVLGPSIFTAIQQQLGLKLEGQKAPIEILVIDRAEKATEN